MQEKIKNDMTASMLAREAVRVTTLRGLMAAFTNELVAKRRKPDGTLSDEEALEVIRRAVKQRRDSIEQFEKGGRADLAANEKQELTVLDAYLPSMMPREAIRPLVEAKMKELGVSEKSKAGQLVGALMKELKGKADGADVKSVVEELLT